MLSAVRRLNEFEKDCKARKKDLKSIYEIIKREEDEEYQKKPANEKTRFLETTIHNQRRLVSQFYAIMKMTLDLKLVPEKYIFRYWNSITLKEILDIVDPLGYDKDKRLRVLYNQAVKYEKKHKIKEVIEADKEND